MFEKRDDKEKTHLQTPWKLQVLEEKGALIRNSSNNNGWETIINNHALGAYHNLLLFTLQKTGWFTHAFVGQQGAFLKAGLGLAPWQEQLFCICLSPSPEARKVARSYPSHGEGRGTRGQVKKLRLGSELAHCHSYLIYWPKRITWPSLIIIWPWLFSERNCRVTWQRTWVKGEVKN